MISSTTIHHTAVTKGERSSQKTAAAFDLLLHQMISCVYKSEVHSGDPSSPYADTKVVNFAAKDNAVAPELNAMTPGVLNNALAPSRIAVLSQNEDWKCSTCDDVACNVCSSVVVVQEDSRHVLSIIERFHLSCSDKICASKARQKRNDDSKKGAGNGCGFRLAFRGAHASMA